MLQMILQIGVIADFLLNQKQIAQERCENKSLPSLACNGKCQMAKMLTEAEPEYQKENSLPDLLRFNLEMFPAIIKNCTLINFNQNWASSKVHIKNNFTTFSGYKQKQLRPPTWIV
ncbi:MAG: hypothetical protein ACK4GL_02295 [Flavobacteriales bacterium]